MKTRCSRVFGAPIRLTPKLGILEFDLETAAEEKCLAINLEREEAVFMFAEFRRGALLVEVGGASFGALAIN